MLQHLKLRNELFWDIDLDKLDERKNKRLIIERVLNLGEIEEFLELVSFYNRKTLLNELTNIAYFDPKTLKFIISYFGVKQEDLKCFIQKQ